MNNKDFIIMQLQMNLTSNKKINRNKSSYKMKYPYAIERDYIRWIRESIIKKFTNYIKEVLIPSIDLIKTKNDAMEDIPGLDYSLLLSGSIPDHINTLQDIDTLIFDTNRDILKARLESLGKELYANNIDEFKKFVKSSIGVIPMPIDSSSAIDLFVENNVSLIRGLDQELIKDVSTAINNNIQQGLSAYNLTEVLGRISDKFEGYRGQLVARDQTNKFWGQLTKMQNKDIGIEKYIWRTAKDERVREDHKIMGGLYCDWNDVTVCSYNGVDWFDRTSIGGVLLEPGMDYQCRCYAEADFSEILDEAESKVSDEYEEYKKIAEAKGFTFNSSTKKMILAKGMTIEEYTKYLEKKAAKGKITKIMSEKQLVKGKNAIGSSMSIKPVSQNIINKELFENMDIDTKYKTMMYNSFKDSPDFVQKYVAEYGTNVKIVKEFLSDSPSTYDPLLKAIKLVDKTDTAEGLKTLRHEFGHYIDNMLSIKVNPADKYSYYSMTILEKSNNFRSAVDDAIKKLSANTKAAKKLRAEVQEELINLSGGIDQAWSTFIEKTKQYSPLHDMVDGFSNKKVTTIYGHSKEYWNRGYGQQQSETFAHLFQVYSNADSEASKNTIKFLDKHFPGITTGFIEALNDNLPKSK